MNGWPKASIWRAAGAAFCCIVMFVAFTVAVFWLYFQVEPHAPPWATAVFGRHRWSLLGTGFTVVHVWGLIFLGVPVGLVTFRLWRVRLDDYSFVSGSTADYPRIRRRPAVSREDGLWKGASVSDAPRVYTLADDDKRRPKRGGSARAGGSSSPD